VVAEEDDYEVNVLDDDDSVSMESFYEEHNSQMVAENFDAGESSACLRDYFDDVESENGADEDGDAHESWDDEDCGLSVVMFGSECEFEVNHKVAESMAGDLVSGPSGLLESSVRMVELFDSNLGPSCELPEASSAGPCMRRRFSQRLRPSEIGPIIHEECLPTDCLPLSQPVAGAMPPCTEIERYFRGYSTQSGVRCQLSAEAVSVLFGSANMSYASLFQAAATEACLTIQKHWRLHQEREVLKKLKAEHRSLVLSSASAEQSVGISSPKPLSSTLVEAHVETSEIMERACHHLDLVALENALRSDFEGLEFGNSSPESIEVCHAPSQVPPPPTAPTPTGRRRPQLGKKVSASILVEDGSNTLKLEDSEEVAIPPRRRPHLSGKRSVDAPATSSAGDLCTLSAMVEVVPSPPPGPSPVSKRRPSVAKKTHVDSNVSNVAVRPAPPPMATASTTSTTSTPRHNLHPEKKSTRNYLSIKVDTVDSNNAIDPVKRHVSALSPKMDQNDIPTPTSAPRRHLSSNIAAAVSRWPPTTLESSVKPKSVKQHTVASGGLRHRMKDTTKVYRMDENEDGTDSVRASSLARGYQALGVEIFNLDSDVESRPRRPKPQKISKSGIAPFLEPSWPVSPGKIGGESLQTRVLASSGQAVLGTVRNRGISLPANSGRTAMELDLGICPTPKTQMDSVKVSLETPRKASFKSSLLPSLATPEKSAGRIAWSVKMAHVSTPRGGHQSVF